MKITKRVMLICLALSMSAMVFTACGSEKSGKESSKKDKDTSSSVSDSKNDSKTDSTTDSKDDSSTADTFKKGTITATSFESSYLNLKFTAPSDFIMATDEQMIQMVNKGADASGIDKNTYDYAAANSVYEMMATSPSGYPNVIVMEEKQALASVTAETYCTQLSTGLKAITTMKYTVSDDMKKVNIAGQEYTSLTAKCNVSGKEVNQEYYVRIVGGRAVCMIVTYLGSDTKGRDTIINSFSALS